MSAFRPRIQTEKTDFHIVFNDKDEMMGTIQWHEEWKAFIFYPNNRTFYGPAFLAFLTGEMIRLEAKRNSGAP